MIGGRGMADFALRRLDGDKTLPVLDILADAYLLAYADDPDIGHSIYARDAFIERTSGQAKSPDFTLIAAYAGDQLAGFSFGLPFPAGRWWRGGSNTEPPAELVSANKFAVIELVVLPDFQGQGLATRLMQALLENRPEPYAMLLADQEGHARSIYDQWGWQAVQRLQPAEDVAALDVLVLGAGQAD
jgi:GNAT superfamily N-acetyltransferase